MTTAVSEPRPGGGGSGGARGRNRHAETSDVDRTPLITADEEALLAEIPTKFADKPWIIDSGDTSGMPWTGQLVRSSSAAANLQTHPSYTSGLFDPDVTARPVSGADSDGEPPHLQRPKTGGPLSRRHGRTVGKILPTSGWKHERRLTLTGVETISESNLLTRRTFAQRRLSADLKVKVSLRPI